MSSMSIQDLIKSLTQGRDDAKAANEGRYKEILGLLEGGRNTANNQLNATGQFFKDRIGQTMSYLDSSGRAAKRDAGLRSGERMAEGRGDLADRGFGTSATLQSAMRRREGETLGRELEDIDERVSSQKAGAYQGTSGDLANFMFGRTQLQQDLLGNQAGFMERRTDTGGGNDMLELIRLLGQGGGAAGGGGGFRRGGGYGLSIGQQIGGRRIA